MTKHRHASAISNARKEIQNHIAYMALLFCSLAAFSHTSQAAIPVFRVISGAAKVYGTIVGQTTVTPSYRINSWRQYHARGYGQCSNSTDRSIEVDLMGVPFYETYSQNSCGGTYSSTSPFALTSLVYQNFFCDRSVAPNQFWEREWELFDVKLWLASVTTTGLYPNTGPFEVQILGRADQLATDCNSISPFSRQFAFTRSLKPYGSVVLRVIWIDYSATRFWPFQVKAL